MMTQACRWAALAVLLACSCAQAASEVKTLAASNDGVVLHYGLYGPEGGGGKLPLVVDVSPGGPLELDVAKNPAYDPAPKDFIVLRLPPFGRGGLRWSPFGERDALQVIRHVMAECPVDPERVYLLGATQGFSGSGYGTKKLQYGTLALAYHNPDLFAAVCTGASDNDKDTYRAAWLGDWHQYQLQYAFPLRLREMPILWGDNLLSTPTWLVIPGGGRDELQFYYEMDRNGPAELKVLFAPGVTVPALPPEVAREQLAWLMTHRMERLPKRVVVATDTLKHARNRWARVDALSEVNVFCRLEARVTEDGRVKVRGANFEAFTLTDLDKLLPGRAAVDVDIEHEIVKAAPGASVSFCRVEGKWRVGHAQGEGLAKNDRMTDTLIEAFREPYILVVGSGDPALRQLALDTINAIQNGGMAKPIDLSSVPIRMDAQVTDADMQGANLVLFGDERTNRIIARINAKLPIQLDAGKIISGERTFSYPDQGLMMVCPNPLASARKVVIVTAAIHRGYFLTDKDLAKAEFPANLPAHGFPMLGDWVVFRTNGKGVAKKDRDLQGLDNAIVEGGFFDARWQPMRTGPYYFFNTNFAK